MAEIRKLPKSKLEIVSSIPWSEWKKYVDSAVEKLGKEIKIAGFRPGKAPRHMVEAKVGNLAILEEAGAMAIQKDYMRILEDEKLDVVGRPQAQFLKLAEGSDLEYKILSAVMPEVKMKDWKPEIKKINEQFSQEKQEVSSEEVQKELEFLANTRASLVTVRREAREGDNVIVDFQVLLDGVPIENGTSRNHPIVLGKGVFIPGFEENIIGMKEKDEKHFTLKFPESYHEKSLAGREAQFRVKVNLVQERRVPDISDSFAQSLGKFENLTALKESISEGLLEEKKLKAKEKRRANFIDKLVDYSEIDLPEILIEEEIAKMINELSSQVSQMGMKLEEYLAKLDKTTQDLERDWRPQAEKRVKAALIMEELAKNQSLEVSSQEIEKEMNKTLQYYKSVKNMEKNIDLQRLYNYTKSVLLNEEVFKWLESL